MPTLTNGYTGKPVTVPDELVERFKAAGFKEPATPVPEQVQEPERPAPRRLRATD